VASSNFNKRRKEKFIEIFEKKKILRGNGVFDWNKTGKLAGVQHKDGGILKCEAG
jgi:hypothetical protein